jgi:hypothetical protein
MPTSQEAFFRPAPGPEGRAYGVGVVFVGLALM